MNTLILYNCKLSGPQFKPQEVCSSNHLFCNLIGLHSWWQQDKSVHRRFPDLFVCAQAKIWLCLTKQGADW